MLVKKQYFQPYHRILLHWQRKPLFQRAIFPMFSGVFVGMAAVWIGTLLAGYGFEQRRLLWMMKEGMVFMMRFSVVLYLFSLVWCVLVRFYRIGSGWKWLLVSFSVSGCVGWLAWRVLEGLFASRADYLRDFKEVGTVCVVAVALSVLHVCVAAFLFEREKRYHDAG